MVNRPKKPADQLPSSVQGESERKGRVFERIAALAGFSPEDFEEFFATAERLSPAEIGAVLGYLLGRLDSYDATAMLAVLRRLHPARKISIRDGRTTVNIVGTGGGAPTFNITTTAAFVVAAAGPVVVKTGSAACRSRSGFADVATRLGTLKVTMPWEQLEAIANDVGMVFIPPSYHAPVLGRLEYVLTKPTYRNVALYFNKLGPLLAPVKVDYRFIGAHTLPCLEMLAGACEMLGDLPAMLVSSKDGLDEVSSMDRTAVVELSANGARRDWWVDPQQLGLEGPSLEELAGNDPAGAAQCCEHILSGRGTRAQSEIVALNAAVVLSFLGVCGDIPAGFQAALQILKDGRAMDKLRALRQRVWKCAEL